jgi:hypothetical protein
VATPSGKCNDVAIETVISWALYKGPPKHNQFKLMTLEALERIKEEYTYLQDQIQSLKLECAKLAQEKTEMQRHYVMAYRISSHSRLRVRSANK